MTRVLVVAESPMERAGLESLIAHEPPLTVVGHAGRNDGHATLSQQVEALDPDVVVVAMADGDDESFESALESLTRALAEARAAIVVLSDARDATRALRYGVRALLPRGASASTLGAAIAAAAAGLVVLQPDVAGALAFEEAAPMRPPSDAERGTEGQDLTAREMEVLHMLAEGLGNKQIAARLGISEHTVKFHVASIFAKLHASTRTEAVMLGARRGLVVI